MIRLRVSDLDAWVRYVEPEREEWATSTEEFLTYMRREGEPTPNMLAGSAFHDVMEHAHAGDDLEYVEARGFGFTFADDLGAVALAQEREEPCEGVYPTPSGPVLLRGRVDGRTGIEVVDYKLTGGRFDAERLARSLQWRSYLDLTGADRFRYVVFRAKINPPEVYVFAVEEVTFWSYGDMRADVTRRVSELAAFVVEHVPEFVEAA